MRRILSVFSVIIIITSIFITAPCFPESSAETGQKNTNMESKTINNENKPIKNIENTETVEKNNENNDIIPEIKLSVNKNKVKPGDILELSLEFILPDESAFNLSEDLTGLEVLTLIDKSGAGSRLSLTAIIDKTESFDIGPLSLSFKDKKGGLNIIKSESIHVEIVSGLGPKPEEARLKPINGIIPTYPLWLKLLPWACGIIVLGVAALLFLYLKKKRKAKTKSLFNIKEPHIVAEEEIKKLIGTDLIKKGAFKEFYFRLSEIIRDYIEALRGFPAAELTTEEIIKRIKNEKDRNVIPLLRWMDMVKFADTIPSGDRNEQDVKQALDYVKDTAPAANTPGSGNKAA